VTRARRWLLGLATGAVAVAVAVLGVAAATLLPACQDCDNPPPDSCVPEEGTTREEACARCGGVYHGCRDGKWVPFPCGGGMPGGRDR
jgi:hypothetical protein